MMIDPTAMAIISSGKVKPLFLCIRDFTVSIPSKLDL